MGLPRGKIPVFCAIIDKVDTALPIAKAVLRDETGEVVFRVLLIYSSSM